MATADETGSDVMAVSKHESRPLPYLVTVGAVAAATVAVFFGIGFLRLAPPHPVAPPPDPISRAQALEAHEVPLADNDAVSGPSSPPAGKVTASTTPSVPSNREAPVLLDATGVETARVPPAGITQARKVRVGRQRHQGTERHWVALWRSDASGPNPGGGFYGPPNMNVGYVNPR
jgi:hypothetical protein